MLEDYLKSFQILSEDEIQNFINQGEAKKVKKGGFLAESGKVNNKIFFINEGILRSFYWSSTEEDITSSNYWADTSQSPLYKRQTSRSPKYKNY